MEKACKLAAGCCLEVGVLDLVLFYLYYLYTIILSRVFQTLSSAAEQYSKY